MIFVLLMLIAGTALGIEPASLENTMTKRLKRVEEFMFLKS